MIEPCGMKKESIDIVATIGPASDKFETLANMANEGLTICRLNFSHGSHEEHLARIDTIKKLNNEIPKKLLILQDLCGPKIRVGVIGGTGEIILREGETITLTTREVVGDEKVISVSIPTLAHDVEPGVIIKIEDGKKSVRVEKVVDGTEIVCTILVGGILKSKKGINIPNRKLSLSAFTEKDKNDLLFGISQQVDYVALSFVQTADDIFEIKEFMKARGVNIPVIAKIETTEAIKPENLEAIVNAVDGIMVARGDLAVEVGFEKVPFIQKKLIKMCNEQHKFVITATQMLESMEQSTVPTRAEVSDIANAVLDGTDAVMLSGESAVGRFPVEAVKVLHTVSSYALLQ